MADKEDKTVETPHGEGDSKSKKTLNDIQDAKVKESERTKKGSESEGVALGNTNSEKGSKKSESKDVKESDASVSDVTSEAISSESKSLESKSSESNDQKSEVSDVGKDTVTLENGGTEKKNEDEIVEEAELLDLQNLVPERRNKLFQQGLDYEKSSQTDCALKCYLSCLTGLRADTHFVLLPQCLRNIADIYFKKQEYEKAILFIQAEKLYYENALIDTTEIQNTLEKLRNDQSTSDTTEPINEDSVRADEYENLAKLCMDQQQPHLALEYAGKATKIRQQIYGNDHQTTKDSLDYFATLYAEVGRKQYSDSMHQLSSESDQDYKDYQNISPTSILRQRRKKSLDTSDEKERKKTVRFGEPIETRILLYEENIPRSFTVLFFLFSFLVILILGTWLFCIMRNDHVCRSFSSELQYLYNKFRYFIYNYTGSKKFKN